MNTFNKPSLIGIAGTFASGKDTIANKLVTDFGFNHVSTSDMVREVAHRERSSVERPVLYEVAAEHRLREGAGVFVNYALQKPFPLVVTGMRSLGEAKAIKEAGGVMVFIDAPAKLRYARMKTRLRDDETQLSFGEFEANEQKEWHTGDSDADFNLRDIMATADIVFSNESTMDDLLKLVYQKLGFSI